MSVTYRFNPTHDSNCHDTVIQYTDELRNEHSHGNAKNETIRSLITVKDPCLLANRLLNHPAGTASRVTTDETPDPIS
eukprot:gene24400-biopygen10011